MRNLTERIPVAGLTERYAESVVLMKHYFQWPNLPAVRHKNVNAARPRKHTLSESVHAHIVERNALDIQLYEFAEQRLQEQITAAPQTFSDDLANLGFVPPMIG